MAKLREGMSAKRKLYGGAITARKNNPFEISIIPIVIMEKDKYTAGKRTMRIVNDRFLPPNYNELGLETALFPASGKSWGPQSKTLIRKLTPEGKRHWQSIIATQEYYDVAKNLGLPYEDARSFVDEFLTDEEMVDASWDEIKASFVEAKDCLQYLAEWKAGRKKAKPWWDFDVPTLDEVKEIPY